MKNKKSFLTLGIIVLVLFLGVGYAVVSSVYLNIEGTASVIDSDLKVEITNVVASTSVSDKTLDFTNVLSNKNLNSDFTLNGMELNEKVTITYTVTNNETDVDAELKLASGVELTNSNDNYFDVAYEITDNTTDLASGDKTMEVVVTVELVQTPVTEEEGTTTVGLKLTASPKGGSTGSGSNDSSVGTLTYNTWYKNADTGAKIAFGNDGIVFLAGDEVSAMGANMDASVNNDIISMRTFIGSEISEVGKVLNKNEIELIDLHEISSSLDSSETYIYTKSNLEEDKITNYFTILTDNYTFAYINNEKSTWRDFINSSYNDFYDISDSKAHKNFIEFNDSIYWDFDGLFEPLSYNGNRVKIDDEIITDEHYGVLDAPEEVKRFTIENQNHNYRDGMTWDLYINSSYLILFNNVELSTDSDGYILYNGKKIYISGEPDTFVHKDDLIAETEYILAE